MFARVALTSIGSDNDLVPSGRQANIWTNDGLVWWRMYASLGLNELTLMWRHSIVKREAGPIFQPTEMVYVTISDNMHIYL